MKKWMISRLLWSVEINHQFIFMISVQILLFRPYLLLMIVQIVVEAQVPQPYSFFTQLAAVLNHIFVIIHVFIQLTDIYLQYSKMMLLVIHWTFSSQYCFNYWFLADINCLLSLFVDDEEESNWKIGKNIGTR